MLLLVIVAIILIFTLLPSSNKEPIAYAIFITIIISDADLHFLNKIWDKLFKKEEKNPLL
jgi:hypothetical protein